MKIELDISEKNEGTDSPWWIVIDPKQNMKADVDQIANMIVGPFFSREDAQTHLKQRRYAFSKRATVYCMSGYWSDRYKMAIRNSK